MNELQFANAVEEVLDGAELTSVYEIRDGRRMRIITDVVIPQYGFWRDAIGQYYLSRFDERGRESRSRYFSSSDMGFMSRYILIVTGYFIRRKYGFLPVYIPAWEEFIRPGFPWYSTENGFRVEWVCEGRSIEASAEYEPEVNYVQLTQFAKYGVDQLIELLQQERPSELFVFQEDLRMLDSKYGDVLPYSWQQKKRPSRRWW